MKKASKRLWGGHRERYKDSWSWSAWGRLHGALPKRWVVSNTAIFFTQVKPAPGEAGKKHHRGPSYVGSPSGTYAAWNNNSQQKCSSDSELNRIFKITKVQATRLWAVLLMEMFSRKDSRSDTQKGKQLASRLGQRFLIQDTVCDRTC
jgi:hypothetical protein